VTPATRPHPDGIALSVRLTPKSSKNALIGLRDRADGTSVLAIKVTPPPDKGKANAALVKLMAKSLHMAPGKVELLSGHSSRNKEVLVRGETDAIMAAINKWLEETTHG
jgi:uncharacterized protein (TIGR00251 family)